MGAVYLITSPSGKGYVGITSRSTSSRFDEHCSDATSSNTTKHYIHRAIRKYGQSRMNIVTLVIADDWEYLRILERNAIKVLNTLVPCGYNLVDGGQGRGSYSVTTSTKQKIGNALRGKKKSEVHKQKMREASLGKKHTDSAKLKCAIAAKKRIHSPVSEETRAKIKKARALQIVGPHSTEHKQKISDSVKKSWLAR